MVRPGVKKLQEWITNTNLVRLYTTAMNAVVYILLLNMEKEYAN
jgi:hypothetical protein